MASLKTLLIIYIFGGLTFIPLLVVGLVALVWYTSPVVPNASTDNTKTGQDGGKPEAQLDDATAEVKRQHKTSSRVYRSGWVTVRRTYEPTADVGNDAGYMTMMATSYRSFVDSRSKDPRKSRPRDKYYAVLKDTVLFLYEDEQENDCFAAIKLPLHEVVIYPEDLIEGELFMKKNAICLKPILKAGEDGIEEVPSLILRPNPVSTNGSGNAPALESSASLSRLPWFIFPSINHDKEDWYHSLVSASKLPLASEVDADASLFDSDDMGNLVDAIDDQPDPIPTRWLNAMIGRLFFSVYRTSAVEDYIVRKLMRKLSKVNKPDFLGDIEVKEVDVGNTTPFFSKPMLKELTAEGDASMEVHVKYAGEFRIAISTTATLNLGQRFKSYSVKLVLAIILKDLEGNMLFKVKRPPSNRVWFGFTAPPKLGLRIEPVVSTRQIKWSLVTKPIESRLRELVAESIVLPHMDDIAFFDTKQYGQRGGIYGDCARRASDLRGDAGDEMEPALETEESNIFPGVPNVKLGDPKEAAGDGVRHRPARPRKSSGSESLMSTKSMPIGAAAGAEKPSAFTLSSWGTSTSLDHPASESKQQKHGDHDHSRKKSWFSTTSPSAKGRLASTESDSAFPLPATDFAGHSAVSPKRQDGLIHKSSSTSAVPAATSTSVEQEHGDAALEKLRGILEAAKTKKMKTMPAVSTTAVDQQVSAQRLSSGSNRETTLSASPEPSLYKTSSGSSADTAQVSESEVDVSAVAQQELSSTKPLHLTRQKSDRSLNSTHSAAPVHLEQNPFSDNASIMSGTDSASNVSLASSNAGTSSNIAILQNWKTKATDKQAIQASVNQARDAMSKWGSKFQAYRKAQQAATEAEQTPSVQARESMNGENDASTPQSISGGDRPSSREGGALPVPASRPRSISKQDGSLTPESRSRSSSIISSSPKGHFKPSAATTTISLSAPSAASPVTAVSSEQLPQRSPTLHRVPPPSAVPVHPAVGVDFENRAPPPKRKSYTPAPMMSIPGIDDSRRFHVSSADVSDSNARAPPLPARKPSPQEGQLHSPSPKRVPPPVPPLNGGSETTTSTSENAFTSSPSSVVPPPLPARHNNEDLAITSAETSPQVNTAAAASLGLANPPQQQNSPRDVLESSAIDNRPGPAKIDLIVQPPTPSPGPVIHADGTPGDSSSSGT